MVNYKLKEARIKKGLSQTELAERAGITVQTLCLIERGRYNPSLKVCTALCRTLGCTLDDVFWEPGDGGERED